MPGAGGLRKRSFVQLRPLMGAAAVHWGFDSGRGDSAEFASQNGRIMLNLTAPYWELGWAALVGYFVDKGSEGTEALYLSGTN